ncbi:sensor histidine kinase [Pseudoflavonifractor sp. MSJ-37]|uniref:sensor histidine kinase n=1 Tax=Pseudoflavonifractor sp. MSJ-37 TaxID=2841531 RepID=UPI0035304C12
MTEGRPKAFRRLAAAVWVVCAAAAFWSSVLLASHWDDLWSGGDFYQSGSLYRAEIDYGGMVTAAMDLSLRESWGEELDYLDRLRLDRLTEALRPENTNYRVQVRLDDGTLLYSSLAEGEAMSDLKDRQTARTGISAGDELHDRDWVEWDEEGDVPLLRVWTDQNTCVTFDPRSAADTAAAQPYGYRCADGSGEWQYDEALDGRLHAAAVVIESGVTAPLTVQDGIWEAELDYQTFQRWLGPVTVLWVLSLSAALALLARLCRSDLTGPVRLCWWDRIPYELTAGAAALLLGALVSAGDPVASSIERYGLTVRNIVGMGALSAAGAAGALVLLGTTLRQIRSRRIPQKTLCGRLYAWVRRTVRRAADLWPMSRRTVWLFLLYLLGTVLTGLTVVLIPVYQGVALWAICRWVEQWRTIRTAAGEILGGKPETRIDTAHMYRDLREHAEQLNDLGSSISAAVEERLRSERFRAELITNVSHDLKTPLTSIINYVDLLKKTDIRDPAALEYVAVLERKSQRLKKLTEDLVEASKASTGTLPVELVRLDLGQLVRQALGEYEEKFRQAELTPVLELDETGPEVLADGRHLWRVVDNLLGNCCKYAMSGTRVYLETALRGDMAELTVKNISRAALNVPPERLMERFVRGDTARTTEGSGLGLSIAQSLTELQGGTFRLEIDGDLFKAEVGIPLAPAEPERDTESEERTEDLT